MRKDSEAGRWRRGFATFALKRRGKPAGEAQNQALKTERYGPASEGELHLALN